MNTEKPHTSGCRVCGKRAIKARGLCEAHFQRFRLKMRSFATPEDAEAYEARLIELGWLAPKAKTGRKKVGDVFDQVAEEVTKSRATKKKTVRRKKS